MKHPPSKPSKKALLKSWPRVHDLNMFSSFVASLWIFFWLSKQRGNLSHSCRLRFMTRLWRPMALRAPESRPFSSSRVAVQVWQGLWIWTWCCSYCCSGSTPANYLGLWERSLIQGGVLRQPWLLGKSKPQSDTSRLKTKVPGLERVGGSSLHIQAPPPRFLVTEATRINTAALWTLQYQERGLHSSVCG